MNPWRWLFGAKVRVLRLRPGDVVVLEATRPVTLSHLEAVKDKWAEELPDVPVVVTDGLRLGGVVRSETTGGYASSGRPATDLRPPPSGLPPGAPTTTRPDPWIPERRTRPDPWRKAK